MSGSEHIATMSFNDLARRIKDDAVRKRHPASMVLETTYRCNVSCIHCYVPQSAHPEELSTRELIQILDEAADLGVIYLVVSGGEPMVRSDFLEVWEHAKSLGMLATLFTNATLVTDEIADALAEYPPAVTEITLHSMRPQVFDAVTTVPGSFDRCMEGIGRLRDRGLDLRLKSVALRQNAEWIREVEAYAKSIGVHYRFDVGVIPRLDSEAEPLKTRLDPEDAVALDLAFPGRADNFLELAKTAPGSTSTGVFNCGGGKQSFSVNPYGKMSMCPLTQYEAYDVRNGCVAEGWFDFVPVVRARKASTENVCLTCDQMWLCQRCPAKAYLEVGHEESPIPYWCELATLRRSALSNLARIREAEPFGVLGHDDA
jgi:radical SAM protein with 4Fe4S-binding SPASM domain